MTTTAEAGAVRLIARFQHWGFSRTDHGPIAVMHKREFNPLKARGDSVAGVSVYPGAITGDQFREFHWAVQQHAVDLRGRMIFRLLDVYPVMFADSADESGIAAANSTVPVRLFNQRTAHALVHGSGAVTKLERARKHSFTQGVVSHHIVEKRLDSFLG